MTTPFPFVAGAVLQASQLNAITTLPINDQTASYSLVVGDVGKRVVMDVATANTVTVDDSIFAAGDTVEVLNKGAGTTTITAGAGVTISSTSALGLVTNQGGKLIALSASAFLFVASAANFIKADYIATSQATTSTSYTDLSTVGPVVTLTTGTSAIVKIQTLAADSVTNRQFMSFAVSGASTIAAGSNFEMAPDSTNNTGIRSVEFVITTLTAGVNTFTAKYKSSDGNSIAYAKRLIKVVTL
jgi:hypothetical protein